MRQRLIPPLLIQQDEEFTPVVFKPGPMIVDVYRRIQVWGVGQLGPDDGQVMLKLVQELLPIIANGGFLKVEKAIEPGRITRRRSEFPLIVPHRGTTHTTVL